MGTNTEVCTGKGMPNSAWAKLDHRLDFHVSSMVWDTWGIPVTTQ